MIAMLNRIFIVAALIVMTFTGACGSDDGPPSATHTREPSPGAVTTRPPISASPSPAPGVTPIAGAYAAEPVFPHVTFPRMVGLYFVPGDPDHAVVLTQIEGRIRRFNVRDSSQDASIVLDLRDRMILNPDNEEGLLGLAFAPDFETSGRFFVHYTAGNPRRNVIARYTLRNGVADPVSETIILEVPQPFANHNGGALAFGPDGMLYIALGDGGSRGDPQGNGQRLDTLLGKILRIDVSGDTYDIPSDNPFGAAGRGEIWAYGFRNPWRISFDRETGDLWAGDVGQNAWEEVNRVSRGGNYGWNTMEGFDCYLTTPCDRDELILPRAVYPTSEGCAITGGYVYRGQALPELRGWYIYGDYCSGRVWAINTADDGAEPIVLIDGGDRITSFAEDPQGELYLVTFGERIYRLARGG